MKLVEALNDLRRDVRAEVAELRRELREEARKERAQERAAYLGLLHKALWVVLILGLALGGKDILALALEVLP